MNNDTIPGLGVFRWPGARGCAARVVVSAGVAPMDADVAAEPTGSAPGTPFSKPDLYDVQPSVNSSDYPIEQIHTAGIPVHIYVKWTMRQ